MTAAPTDVIVIGGGIVGLSAALELQTRGRSVTLVDPGDARARASYGNAGGINPSSIFPVAGPGIVPRLPGYLLGRDIAVRVRPGSLPALLPWARRFLAAANERAWRQAAAALHPMVSQALGRHLVLADLVGGRDLIRHTGFMRVFRHADAATADRLQREVLAQYGIGVEILDAGAVRELEPHLSDRFRSGWLYTQSASVESPGLVVERFRDTFRQRGGTVLEARAEAIRPAEAGIEVQAGGTVLAADHAVLAAGARSAGLLTPLGYRIPLVAERGYHLHLRPRGNAGLSRPVVDVAGAYVMTPMQGTIRVLSGVELGRPDDPPDHSQIEAVVADAKRSLPLEPLPGAEIWMGSRPSTPDGLPVIGIAPRHERLVLAFGHGHVGFSNGPVTGLAVAQLLAGEPTAFPLAPFSAARFG